MSTDGLPANVQGGAPPVGEGAPTAAPPVVPSDTVLGDQGAGQSFQEAAAEVLNGQGSQPAYENPYANPPQQTQPPVPQLPDPSPGPFTAPTQLRSPGATTQEGVAFTDDTEPGYAASAGREMEMRAAQAQPQMPPRGPDGRFQQAQPQQQSGLADTLTRNGVRLPPGATDEQVGENFLAYLADQNQPQQPQQYQRPADAGAGAEAARAEAAAADARRTAEMMAYRQQQPVEQRMDNWRDYLTNDEHGARVFREGVDANTQARVLDMARQEREIQEQFARDPRGTIDEYYGSMVEDRARAIAEQTVQEQLGNYQVRNRAQNLVQQNESWLYEHDEYGGRKTDPNTGRPQLSVAGTLVNRQVDRLSEMGINDPDQQWGMAMQLGELEYRQNYDRYARDLAVQSQQRQQAQNGQQAMAPQQQYPQQQPAQQPNYAQPPSAPVAPAGNDQHRQNYISQFAQGHVAAQVAAGEAAYSPNMNGVISRAADPNQPPVDPVESFRSMATELASQSGLMRGPR